MIFAAGLGTRMGSLVSDQPKPMINVAGKPLIDHALGLASDAEIGNVVVNVHYKAPIIVKHLDGQDLKISTEYPVLLETGGGLRNALPLLGGEPVFTLNSDAVWAGSNPIKELAGAWDPKEMDALLMLIKPEDAIGHNGAGDFIAPKPDKQILRGPGLIYSGIQVMKTDDLRHIQESVFSLNKVWDRMLARGRLCGLVYDGNWCDVGNPKGIIEAEKMLLNHDNV